jgi:hypothetical protein
MIRVFLLSRAAARHSKTSKQRRKVKLHSRSIELTVSGQFQDFSREVLKDSGEVDWKTRVCSQHTVQRHTRDEGSTHLEHQHQFAERSYPSSTFCGYDQQGIEDRPLKT